jgi:epoxyqueuosine reductase
MTVLPEMNSNEPLGGPDEANRADLSVVAGSRVRAIESRELVIAIKRAACDIGFDLVGIADIQPSPHHDYIAEFFALGRHGAMDYLARMAQAKIDIRSHLPWASSAVCVAMSYHHSPGEAPAQIPDGSAVDTLGDLSREVMAGHADRPENPFTAVRRPDAKIASYTAGRDYHRIFTGLLQKLERAVRALMNSDITARAYVDTGPCLERELAARAGLGWIGKNTMMIHPRHGSWFLLGELFLSVALPADPPVPDRCGTCTRCITACPTDALTPYRMDASKCISYLTLENRGDIPEEFHAPMREAEYIIGCDICQSVCPFNRRPLAASHPDFQPRAFSGTVSPQTVLRWTKHDWDQATRGRAFRRAKFNMWQRNAAILLGACPSNQEVATGL